MVNGFRKNRRNVEVEQYASNQCLYGININNWYQILKSVKLNNAI